MGQCFTCFRSNAIPQTQQEYDNVIDVNRPIIGNNYYTSLFGVPKCVCDFDSNKESESVDGKSSFDNQSNGSKISHVMPEKRSFYSRIPPLAKSSSNEMRKVSARECSDNKINALFEQYKDRHSDVILSDGIIRFCADLEVRPDDFKVLVLAWKFGAETMCRFTREEFLIGCQSLKVDSIKGIQSKFSEMLTEIESPEKFKDLYRFTYKFGLDLEGGQRILPTDMAVQLWRLVFSRNEPPILRRWIAFLENHPSIRGIPRDTWFMFLNFTESVTDDLSMYDDAEAWPSLLDDFVEFENDQINQNVKKD